MAIELHQGTAALYLAAAIASALGLALPAPRVARASVWLLAAGAALHAASFGFFHTAEPAIPLADVMAAISISVWIAVVFSLVLLWRVRLAGLVVLVASLAFVGVFVAALRLPQAPEAGAGGTGSWPHAHILLASGGFACLAVAGLAGLLYLVENRRLKAKRRPARFRLPSLEALDRVNTVALAVGFPLLTLGLVTGMLWAQTETGRLWTGSPHQTWSAIGWAVYAVLAGARFAGSQGARSAAASAVAGSAFLLFAVIGVGLLA